MLNLLTVPLIMGCAMVGTVGMIKLIKKVSPERFDRTENIERREDTNK